MALTHSHGQDVIGHPDPLALNRGFHCFNRPESSHYFPYSTLSFIFLRGARCEERGPRYSCNAGPRHSTPLRTALRTCTCCTCKQSFHRVPKRHQCITSPCHHDTRTRAPSRLLPHPHSVEALTRLRSGESSHVVHPRRLGLHQLPRRARTLHPLHLQCRTRRPFLFSLICVTPDDLDDARCGGSARQHVRDPFDGVRRRLPGGGRCLLCSLCAHFCARRDDARDLGYRRPRHLPPSSQSSMATTRVRLGAPLLIAGRGALFMIRKGGGY